LIEIVSAFGPAGIVAYAEATRVKREDASQARLDMARSGELVPATASSSEHGRVVKRMAERTEPTTDPAAVTIDDLHADYEVWCLANGLKATPLGTFNDEFDRVREVPQLSGQIRKFGNRYYGICLACQRP